MKNKQPLNPGKKSNLEDHIIPMETAIRWTKQWRDKHPGLVKAFRIETVEFDEIKQYCQNPEYVRAYLAINDKGLYSLVFVALDKEGKDHRELAFDFTTPCPSTCDETSPLVNDLPANQ